MHRILANENVPGDAVRGLRERGHDVVWARESMPGASDDDVLARALVESRILVTFDRDFGEMEFRRGMSASCGIVLFRISCPSPDVAVRRIVHALESRNDWKGSYAVVEDARVRLVALPA